MDVNLDKIIHVSKILIFNTFLQAQHAEKTGVTAIACMAPFYNKPKNEGKFH